jgi:isopenicillin-N epimerase
MIYGAALRDEWELDPHVAYLNHGGYGATPRVVAAEQQRWRARIERNPTKFLSRELPEALRAAAAEVAAALGGAGEDLVFVENATSAVNAVLRSLSLAPGDEIVIASTAYPAIRNAAAFTAEKGGARLVAAEVVLPVPDESAVVDAFARAIGPRTRLVIVDHIASASALLMPLAPILSLAHAAGAKVLVDGAHAPGQVPVALDRLGADWYAGNLHKWYFAPRACGVLWARAEARKTLHPLAISHGLGQGFTAEFDWTGTHDFSAPLATPMALAFHEKLGGARLMARNSALARQAAIELARAWRTDCAAPETMAAAMAAVRLPFDGEASPARARAIQRWLSDEHRIEAAVNASSGALWVRVAAQAYNELADYERLLSAVARGQG